jgi:DnaK suppressor protein
MIKRHGHKKPLAVFVGMGEGLGGQSRRLGRMFRLQPFEEHRMAGLNPGQLPQFDRLLTEQYHSLIHQVRDQLEHSEHEQYRAIATQVAALGERSAAAMLVDLGSPTFDHQIAELRHILSARRRIEQGTYGVCEICGVAIDLPWLRSHPSAARCPGCEHH